MRTESFTDKKNNRMKKTVVLVKHEKNTFSPFKIAMIVKKNVHNLSKKSSFLVKLFFAWLQKVFYASKAGIVDI